MTFFVDTEALTGLPALLGRLDHDAASGRAHLVEHTKVRYQGILNHLRGGHEAAVTTVAAFLETVSGPVARRTANALVGAVEHYRTTDRATAATWDALYAAERTADPTGLAGRYGDRTASAGRFQDAAEPTDRYAVPADHSREFPYEPRWKDLFSPTSQARDAIWLVTGALARLGYLAGPIDGHQVILRPVVGDWAAFRRCAEVFRQVGDALDDMGSNLHVGVRDLGAVWRGHAAGRCETHLVEAGTAVAGGVDPLYRLARAYDEAADGAHRLFETLAELVTVLADSAVHAASAIAVAAVTSWTGVGLGVFGGIAVEELIVVVDTINQIREILHALEVIATAVSRTGDTFGLIDARCPLPELPANGVALPSARPERVRGPAGMVAE